METKTHAYYLKACPQLGFFLSSTDVCVWAGWLSERSLIRPTQLAPTYINVRVIPTRTAGDACTGTIIQKPYACVSKHKHLSRWHRMLTATAARLNAMKDGLETDGIRPNMGILISCDVAWGQIHGHGARIARVHRSREDRLQRKPQTIGDFYAHAPAGTYHGD